MFVALGRLGRGAYGSVHGGTCNSLPVAWKTYETEDSSPALARDVLIPQLVPAHPNVVDVCGPPRTGATVVQPLQLMACDAATAAGMRCFSHDDAVLVALGAARGLRHLHAHHVMHRDVKMENILLGVKEDALDVKLCDFSLARVAGVSTGAYATTAAAEPWMTAYVCTQWTRPLELFPCGVAAQYGPEADVWSLGATLWALLARGYPFRIKKADDFEAAMRAALGLDGGALPWPAGARHGIQATVRSTMDRRLVDLLVSMLNPVPRDRPSLDAVIAGLEALGARPSPGTLLFVANQQAEVVRNARRAAIPLSVETVAAVFPRGPRDAADTWTECRRVKPPMPPAVAALAVLATRASACTPAELADVFAAVSTSARRADARVTTRVRVPRWGLGALVAVLRALTPFEACTLCAGLAAHAIESEDELCELAARPTKTLFDSAAAALGPAMPHFFKAFPNAWSSQAAMCASWLRLSNGHELHVMRAADVEDADDGKPADVVGGDAVGQKLGDTANAAAPAVDKALVDEDRPPQQS